MQDVIFRLIALAAACGFVWLGRWMYRNPRKFAKQTCNNPDSRFVRRLARIYGVFFIFGGSYNVLIFVTGLFVSSLTVIIAEFPIAVAATWYLRPRSAETTGADHEVIS